MFTLRKIENGAVKINGKFYVPDESYRGELDGLWYVFGLYPHPSTRDGKMFISLWGTKKQYDLKSADDPDWGRTPDCIEGVFHWVWWSECRPTPRAPD